MGNKWLMFALMTVASWGVYGVFLHMGAVKMGDAVNGRYKAFLWVGIATWFSRKYFASSLAWALSFLGKLGAIVLLPWWIWRKHSQEWGLLFILFCLIPILSSPYFLLALI